MQLVVASWRLTIERSNGEQAGYKQAGLGRIERQARRDRILRQIERERCEAHNRMLLHGGGVQIR